MPLRISRSLLTTLTEQAAASSNEICGLLFGNDERIGRAQACANVAPDPSVRFEIDPASLIAAYRRARAGGARIMGVYHSHPSGRPDPSPRDAADAAPDGWLWLILGAEEARGWRAVPDGAVHGRFDAIAFEDDETVR